MECVCQIDNGSEGGMEPMVSQWAAGVETVCSECGVLVDEFMVEVYIADAGELQPTATCRDCVLIRYALCCDYTIGGLWDDIEQTMKDFIYDCKDFVMPECYMSKLSSGVRARLCSLIEKHWAELDEHCGESEHV